MARTTIRTEDITASEVTTAKMAVDPTNASNLSSGSVPSAQLGNVDLSGIEDDIALLGFQVAANGSLAKYNLVDQTVDAFEPEAGVDLSTSTGEYYNSSGNYYSGADSPAAAWFEGDRTSSVTITSDITWYTTGGTIQNLIDGVVTYSTGQNWSDPSGQTGYVRFDHGVGNSFIYTNSRWKYGHSNPSNEGYWKWQGSDDAASWTDIGGNFILTATGIADDVVRTDTHATMTANTTPYRYYQMVWVSGNAMHGGGRRIEMQFYGTEYSAAGNMVLVSNATTAESAPSKGDIVLTWTDGVGTATLGTDLTAEFSADNGSTWTAAPLVDKGTTGSHNIASAHDLTRSSTSGTSMRWRVKTLNQSATKETRIQAVSLGWS